MHELTVAKGSKASRHKGMKTIVPHKRQRGFLIGPELCVAIGDIEKQTGASFTRIATAGLLMFACSAHRDRWMPLSVALDRGKMTLDEIRTAVGDCPQGDGRDGLCK